MAAKRDPSPEQIGTLPLPFRHFDESIELDDPKPFASWEPSPRQIEEWAAVIREEREAAKAEEP